MASALELSAVPLFSLLLAIAALAAAYFRLSNRALDSIPGPSLGQWVPLWMVHHSRKGDMHRVMISLHQKYGPLVRTGPNEVSVADPAAIKAIYGPGSKFRKSDWYSVWQGRRTFDLFAERNEEIHRTQRRLVSAIYSMDALLEHEPYVDNAVSTMLDKLSKMENQVINMSLWAQLFAFDVVGEVTFSKPFGFMDAGKDDGSFAQIDSALKSAAWVGQIPWLYWAQDLLEPVIGNHLGIRARHGSLRSFAAKEVEKRRQRGSDHIDILAKLMQVQKAKPDEMNDMGVLSMATSNIFAGSDTTAISIGAILYHLCQNPTCKTKLLDEITSVFGDEAPIDKISFETAKNMKFLQACIYEALRLHPAVGMSLPRVVPHGGIRISDTYIPSGVVIGVNPWVIHRNKEVFGDDAESFRPERWLIEDRGPLDRFFFAFGAGARLCLGKNLSWIEISKLIPLLLLNFDIELAVPEKQITEDCRWFVKLEGLHMKLRRKVTMP